MSGRKSPGLARSLTRTRSIGARSDWSGTNGETEAEVSGDEADVEADETFPNGKPGRTWTIYKEDSSSNGAGVPHPEDDPDDPINRYVKEQLERIKSHESADLADELAANTDGANDKEP